MAIIEAPTTESASMAACHPKSRIKTCVTGTIANWPNEPREVTRPRARERRWSGTARLTAPSATAMPAEPSPKPIMKLPKIIPSGVTRPDIMISPSAYKRPPKDATFQPPMRSAIIPNSGEETPQSKFWIAMPNEKSSRPDPKSNVTGPKNSPID